MVFAFSRWVMQASRRQEMVAEKVPHGVGPVTAECMVSACLRRAAQLYVPTALVPGDWIFVMWKAGTGG